VKIIPLVTVVFLGFTLIGCGIKEKTTEEIKLGPVKSPEVFQAPCKNIEGKYLKAFLEAYKAFLTDEEVPSNLRNLENYSVSFREDTKGYGIDFTAHRTEEEKTGQTGGGSSLGKDVSYVLSKDGYVVISRQYYK
jgi:hypothetical protein